MASDPKGNGHGESKVVDLMAALERSVKDARAARQHLHAEYVEGCYRCDMSRAEAEQDRADSPTFGDEWGEHR